MPRPRGPYGPYREKPRLIPKTCRNNHEMTWGNTLVSKLGYFSCRICHNAHARNCMRRHRANKSHTNQNIR